MKTYEEIVDFFASGTTPRGISLFKASESTKQRVRELLRLEKQGIATSAEKTELDDFLRLEHLMRLTKVREEAKMYVAENNISEKDLEKVTSSINENRTGYLFEISKRIKIK